MTHRLLRASTHASARRRDESVGHYAFTFAKRARAVRGADTAMRRVLDGADDGAAFVPAVTHMASLLEVEFSDLWTALLERWAMVKEPGDMLTRAADAARFHPGTVSGPFTRCGDTMRAVASIAYHLGDRAELLNNPSVPPEHRTDGTFTLPQLDLALLLDVTYRRVGQCIRAAVAGGLLEVVDAHSSYKLGIGKTYRFNFDCPHFQPPDYQAQLAARQQAHGIADTPATGEDG